MINPTDYNWRGKLVDYLGGDRLGRLERALGRDPCLYVLDPRNAERIPDSDIEWFFRTLSFGVLTELPNGDFRAPRPGATERLYWHGSTKERPVLVSISIEPVISIGAIARLIDTLGWPAECLGLQTGKWGFDLTCYAPHSDTVVMQCEVKTSERDVDRMCQYFEARLNGTGSPDIAKPAQRKNWDAKLAELNSTRPEILWALGPGGYERVYRVERSDTLGELSLKNGAPDNLRFKANQ
jgi:hypothetical protein